jgi:hypothetical protein
MRAHTITKKSRPIRTARHRVLALILAICALAIPASASADSDPAPDGYATPNAISGGSSGSRAPQFPSARQIAMHRGTLPPTGSPKVDPSYTSPNAIAGPLPDRFTVESPAGEPSARASDGFDWPSAAVGAGAAMALVALGGAVLLTLRRRAAISPSTSTS